MNTKRNKNTDSPHFREFFLDQIKDVYWAEKHLSSGLKKMKKAATSPKLAAAFEKHIEETAGQIERLKRAKPRRPRSAKPWKDLSPRPKA